MKINVTHPCERCGRIAGRGTSLIEGMSKMAKAGRGAADAMRNFVAACGKLKVVKQVDLGD